MNLPKDHANNFNLIRLLAAFQVLIVHGLNHLEFEGPLVDALKAIPGVPTFFFISGYLICRSYVRTHHGGLGGFFTNRALRIFPGLWICTVVSVLAVASTGHFSVNNVPSANVLAWSIGQATVFQFYNPDFMRSFGVGVLNGALWTITVELQFYILTPVLFFLMVKRPKVFTLIWAASLGLNVFLRIFDNWKLLVVKLLCVSFMPWVFMFLTGFVVSCHAKLEEQIRRVPFIVLVVAYIISMNVLGSYEHNAQNAINPISFVILGAMLLKLARADLKLHPSVSAFIRKNDLSYGIYLYHMPVINIFLFVGLFTAEGSLVAAVIVTFFVAALSWYFIEKPALSYKKSG